MLLYDYIQELRQSSQSWQERALRAEADNTSLKQTCCTQEDKITQLNARIEDLENQLKKKDGVAARRLREIQNVNRAIEKTARREQQVRDEAARIREHFRSALQEKQKLETDAQQVHFSLLLASMKIRSVINYSPGTLIWFFFRNQVFCISFILGLAVYVYAGRMSHERYRSPDIRTRLEPPPIEWHVSMLRDSFSRPMQENRHLITLEAQGLSTELQPLRKLWRRAWNFHPCTLSMMPREEQESMFLFCTTWQAGDGLAVQEEREKWHDLIRYRTNTGRLLVHLDPEASSHDEKDVRAFRDVEEKCLQLLLEGEPIWHIRLSLDKEYVSKKALRAFMETRGNYVFKKADDAAASDSYEMRCVHDASCHMRCMWVCGPEGHKSSSGTKETEPSLGSRRACGRILKFVKQGLEVDDRLGYVERLTRHAETVFSRFSRHNIVETYEQLDRACIDSLRFPRTLFHDLVRESLEIPASGFVNKSREHSMECIMHRIVEHTRVEIYLTYDQEPLSPETPVVPCLLATARAEAAGLYVHTFVYMSKRYTKVDKACLVDGPRFAMLMTDAVRLVFLHALGMKKPVLGLNIKNPVLEKLWEGASESELQKLVLCVVCDILFPRSLPLTESLSQ